jgi:ADP-heptose:LPS heptosyltransferase
MRFLLSRTDALGDLVVSLPVQARILERDSGAEVHWLVRPYTAPVLEGLPGAARVHLRAGDEELPALMRAGRFDAVLNLSHRDPAVIRAARDAGVPVRVARTRGLGQTWAATHRLWKGRTGSCRHEAEHALDFLAPWGWSGGPPGAPRLCLADAEREAAQAELSTFRGADPRPLLGVILRGSGAGAFPSPEWWNRALPLLEAAGWRTLALAPADASGLPPGDLRGLMARLAGCDAVLSPSTGPAHLAAALGVPLVCLMGRRPHHGPDRWQPLGAKVLALTYPGLEADLQGGMDRLDPAELPAALERVR